MDGGIVIVGAGPAGMAAAVGAAACGRRVTVLDDNRSEGGQIWRGQRDHSERDPAAQWFRRFRASGAELLAGSQIVAGDARAQTLRVENAVTAFDVRYQVLILATGARELSLPFPGWTLPNVMGVGGLQALVKSGLPVAGKRVVVSGSGPLLLAVASYLRGKGAIVPVVAEQAGARALAPFAASLFRNPTKLWQAAALRASLRSTRYLAGSWVVAAEGETKLRAVRLNDGAAIACDYLASAYGFVANTELARLLGCALAAGCAKVDALQRTSIPGIFAAGELTGLGGVDLALAEGEIAGYAAAGHIDLARQRFPLRRKALSFSARLPKTFALRNELRRLPTQDTLVCRCEDVSFARLQTASCWTSAKLHTRCGMGPCQGRVCGPAVEFLFGWKEASVRPPIFPARVESLLQEGNHG